MQNEYLDSGFCIINIINIKSVQDLEIQFYLLDLVTLGSAADWTSCNRRDSQNAITLP